MKRILVMTGLLLAVVAVAGSNVFFSAARCGDAQATAPDFIVSGVCQMACATKLPFREADVVAQPGAGVGQLTRCPVSGVVFAVGEESVSVSHAGKDYYLCCGGCERKFMQNPTRFTKT